MSFNCMTTLYEVEMEMGGRDLNISANEHYEGYDDSTRYFVSVFDYDAADEIEVIESNAETIYPDFLAVMNRYKKEGAIEK